MSRLFWHRGRRRCGSFSGWGGLAVLVVVERSHPVLDTRVRPGLVR